MTTDRTHQLIDPSHIANPRNKRPGLMSSAQATQLAALLGLGQSAEAVVAANVAIAATTLTQLLTIDVAAGTLLLFGGANILAGAGVTNVDLYLRQGTTRISKIAFASIAAAGQAQLGPVVAVVSPGAATTYNLAAFAGAACTARKTGGATGFGEETWLLAVRLKS